MTGLPALKQRPLSLLCLAVALASCGGETKPAAKTACLETSPSQPAPATDGMIFVEGGEFLMGAKPQHDEEGPARKTRVGSFWIDQTEVTNRDFARFVAATGYVTLAERPLDAKTYPNLSEEERKPSSIVFVNGEGRSGPLQWWSVIHGADWRHPGGPDSSIDDRDAFPVVHIGWDDALAYAKWLGRDLPTEAEWEYAARGGINGAAYTWGEAKLDQEKPQANVWQGVFPVIDLGNDGYKAQTAPVGCFPANGYKLHDMAGNVWEWTKDWYAPGLEADDINEPQGPAKDRAYDPADPSYAKHVIKGGSFLCSDDYCLRYRPPARQAGPTDTGSSHIGFRTVLRKGS